MKTMKYLIKLFKLNKAYRVAIFYCIDTYSIVQQLKDKNNITINIDL